MALMLLDHYAEIQNEENYLSEVRRYNFFVVKPCGTIVSGFEYREDAQECSRSDYPGSKVSAKSRCDVAALKTFLLSCGVKE
jgi:hypothetical protein